MFSLPIMITVTIVMGVVQISIWNVFPKIFRDICMSKPALAFIANLAGSSLILTFTGTASVVGICNLAASILFGLYSFIYVKNNKIEGTKIVWKKMWKCIPIYPTVNVIYSK